MTPSKAVSIARLYQAAWFVVSVYFSLLIADVTKEALVPSILDPSVSLSKLCIVVPTLIFYILTAVEAYLWMTPQASDTVSPRLAAFKLLQLFIYFAAVIAQAFLARACVDLVKNVDGSISVWCYGFAALLLFYCLYNLLWIVRPKFLASGQADDAPITRQTALSVAAYYAFFSVVFVLLARYTASVPHVGSYYLVSGAFLIYLGSYLYLWVDWYLEALSPATPPSFP